MKKMTLISLCTLALSSQLAMAAPQVCPSVGAIQAEGLMMVQPDEQHGYYFALQLSDYGTADTWGFVVAVPMTGASSTDDALAKAKKALADLSGNPKPSPFSNRWVCMYNELPQGYKAAAITPITANALKDMPYLRVQ